jgi:hypothetical protein
MKVKSSHIFWIVLLAVSIIAFAFQGACSWKPFSGFGGSKLNMSRFEGFSSKYNNNGTSYSGYDLNASVPSQNAADLENAYMKIGGMGGLYGSPDAGERKDPFYGTQGSLDGTDFGYSNSKGFLQMTQEQKALLTSRGGNATGNDSQFGAYSC